MTRTETRTEIRDGALLLFVAVLEVAVILGGGLSAAWALTVAAVYLVFLVAYLRGLVRRRRPRGAGGAGWPSPPLRVTAVCRRPRLPPPCSTARRRPAAWRRPGG
ncbi:hypothetical protein [Streptomyces sp. NPDC008092]|uniref:hypothetical protein n=1 Tax=Streptomyces sp. NPDC008092 TaxID=3364808 RepID=UPI0036EB0B6F